jgi:hypothetical protein
MRLTDILPERQRVRFLEYPSLCLSADGPLTDLTRTSHITDVQEGRSHAHSRIVESEIFSVNFSLSFSSFTGPAFRRIRSAANACQQCDGWRSPGHGQSLSQGYQTGIMDIG